ncbi:MAG TPA: hypothetical protein VEY92_12330 [Pseudoxanthomonas sp.]|nr:hypothetical protein [Pseudoxanthomonas sp.]
MRAIFATLLLLAATSVLAKNVQLPSNVTLKPGNRSGDYIDTVSHEVRGAAFAKLKLCVAENVSNSPTSIRGGTDVPFQFQSNNVATTTVVGGGETFKYQDESLGTLIAIGTTDGGPSALGLSREVIRFEVKAVADADRTVLRFANITRATADTGSVTNAGFIPVGAWRGAKPLAVIETLQALGSRLDSCLQ